MSSGVSRKITGAVMGTGSNIDIKTIGFRPRRVVLENVTGTTYGMWQDTMPDGSMAKAITAGTKSYITTLGITPLADGFRIGTDTDMNVAAELIHWVADE